MHDRHVVALRPGDGALEEIEVRDGPRGVVGVVQPDHLGFGRNIRGDLVEVGLPAALARTRDLVAFAAREHRPHFVHGVTWIRDERDIARIDEAKRHVADAFFGADQRKRLLLWVELHFEPPLVPIGDRLAELRKTFRFGIAVVRWFVGGLVQGGQDVGRRRQVWVADAESDHVVALRPFGRDLLGDFGE